MSDLISRQAVIDALVKLTNCNGVRELFEYVQEHHLSDMWSGGIVDAIDAVIGVPSVQPGLDEWCTGCKEYDQEKHCCPRWNRVIREALKDTQAERPTGQWLPDNNYAYETRFVCSVCGNSEAVPTIGFTKYKPIWDFCPNCGADMRGEQDEET